MEDRRLHLRCTPDSSPLMFSIPAKPDVSGHTCLECSVQSDFDAEVHRDNSFTNARSCHITLKCHKIEGRQSRRDQDIFRN